MGPRSREIQDTYLRLDETIADFLNFLDKKVGKDNYLIFLTSDHAAAENQYFLKDNKYSIEPVEYIQFINKLKNEESPYCRKYWNGWRYYTSIMFAASGCH
mgnify:CR=1 FL=1